jgi:hypothetical protein|tara:strand:- start:666 stop:1112 length:447 start_codon:yes stop_codon:yes gene_type:complete
MTETTTPDGAAFQNLSDLLTPSKEATIEFPGYDGFNVKLTYLAREELLKLRKKSISTKINRRTRQPEEELNEEVFLKEYTKAVIKGWSGLKMKYLVQLIPVDEDKIADMEKELPYTLENAQIMMENSNDFDAWLTETVGDLANFTTTS